MSYIVKFKGREYLSKVLKRYKIVSTDYKINGSKLEIESEDNFNQLEKILKRMCIKYKTTEVTK